MELRCSVLAKLVKLRCSVLAKLVKLGCSVLAKLVKETFVGCGSKICLT